MKQPPFLKKGDTIALVCPSGYIALENVTTCIEQLKKWGYNVAIGNTIGGQRTNYFAGTDEQRLCDLQQAIDNKKIQAILCARGGYGLSRIIDALNFDSLKKNPKWIIGFSDITVLHSHINANCNLATAHAPMANAFNDLGYKNKYVLSLKKLLQGQPANYSCKPDKLNKMGTTQAQLVGGNLAIINHLIGTNSIYKTHNKILFIEDIGEYVYAIDRMFLQLKRSGLLNNIAALIIGGFTDIKDTTPSFGSDVNNAIANHLQDCNFPVAFNFPIGHKPENYSVKIGVNYKLNITKAKVELIEI
jgi:muramoyltetrapeptide carboxypeptidase